MIISQKKGLAQTDLGSHLTQTKLYNLNAASSNSLLLKVAKIIWSGRREKLYRGKIHHSFLSCDNYANLFSDFSKYIHLWFKEIDVQSFQWEKFVMTSNDPMYIQSELFVKLLWLCDVLINNKEFDNPIGVAYNHDQKEFRIHPGGTRQRALHLFGPHLIDCYYFNPDGYFSEKQLNMFFQTGFKEVNIEDLVPDHLVTWTPEFGTLVPHVMKDTDSIPYHKEIWADKLKKVLENLNLNSNITIPYLEKYYNTNGKLKCNLEFKPHIVKIINASLSKKSLEDEDFHEFRRACILVCRGVDYEDNNLKVTFQNSVTSKN